MTSTIFNRLEESLMALFLVIMTVMTFLQVVLRYVFDSGLIWSLEATTYSFGWLVLLGMSNGIRANTHLAVDLVVNSLSPAVAKTAAMAAVALSLFYAGLMGYGSIIFVDRLMELGNLARDIPVPRWLLLIILPTGFGLLGFRLIQAAVEIMRGTRVALGHQESGKSNLFDAADGDPSGDENGGPA